jgi:hypothetical protein
MAAAASRATVETTGVYHGGEHDGTGERGRDGRRDRVEVGRLAARLRGLRETLDAGELGPDEQRELRRLLYGLHAVVGLHFAKEEEVYLPLLDRELTAAEAQRLFERMEHAGGEHGAVAHERLPSHLTLFLLMYNMRKLAGGE